MDASTAAAVVAILVALLALLVALAQVLQQYFITGQLIRICDSVVYGPMPGQGRRIWEPSQFRFRVVYSIPQIGLPATLFPREAPHVPSYSTASLRLPYLSLMPDADEQASGGTLGHYFGFKARQRDFVGEASWVTFCRTIQYSCGRSARYELVEKDADRHPTDVPVAAMQVSLRDIVVMAFMAGMECTAASFKEQSISMQGACGSITTSQHPTLGAVIHFTPKNASLRHGIRTDGGHIDRWWILRMWDNLSVAKKCYDWRQRGFVEDLEDYFAEGSVNTPKKSSHVVRADHRGTPEVEVRRRGAYAFKGEELPQPSVYSNVARSRTGRDGLAAVGLDDHIEDIPSGIHDGSWTFGVNIPSRSPNPNPALITYPLSFSSGLDSEERSYRRKKRVWRQRIMEPVYAFKRFWLDRRPSSSIWSEAGSERRRRSTLSSSSSTHAPVEERKPNLRFQATVEDEVQDPSRVSLPLPHDSVIVIDRHATPEESLSAADVSRQPPDVPVGYESTAYGARRGSVEENPTMSARLMQAREMQEKRRQKAAKEEEDQKVVDKLEEEHKTTKTRSGQLMLEYKTGETAGPSRLSAAEEEALRRQEERDRERDRRNRARRERAEKRRNRAKNRGRVKWFWVTQMDVVPGIWATPWHGCFYEDVCIGATQVILHALLGLTNDKVIRYVAEEATRQYLAWADRENPTFPAYAINARNGVVVTGQYGQVKVPAFAQKIPPLELHYSYEHQVSDSWVKDAKSSRARTAELMAIDSWLSICGRTPEIVTGRGNLLRKTPALVQFVMDEYGDDFEELQLSATEGGLQVVQNVTGNIMDTLEDQRLSEAEQIYCLVAMLRAVKVARSIIQGVDTRLVDDIILKDAQVYFV